MIREGVKFDCAVKPIDDGTSITGEWFRLDTFAKAKFTGIVKGQTTGESCTMGAWQATSAAGGGTPALLGAVVTFTQGSKITLGQVVMNAPDVGDTIILTPYYFNGEGTLTAGTALTYTAAAAQSLPNRQFINTDNDACATSFAACVNDATYGVPGLLAAVSSATVTISCTEPGGGDRQITCEKNGTGAFDITEVDTGKTIVTDLIQMADIEVYVQDLNRDGGYTHVGARFASVDSGNFVVAVIERAMEGYGPVGQAVVDTDTSA